MKVKYFEEISLTRPTNDVHFNLNQQIAGCLEEDNNVMEKYPAPAQAYLAAFGKEDEAMQQTRKSLLTPEVTEMDNRRLYEYRQQVEILGLGV